MTPDQRKKPRVNYDDLSASTLGIEVAVSTLLGALLGWWLDKQFNTKPWLLVTFLILGAVIGWINVWFQVRKLNEQQDAQKKDPPA